MVRGRGAELLLDAPAAGEHGGHPHHGPVVWVVFLLPVPEPFDGGPGREDLGDPAYEHPVVIDVTFDPARCGVLEGRAAGNWTDAAAGGESLSRGDGVRPRGRADPGFEWHCQSSRPRRVFVA